MHVREMRRRGGVGRLCVGICFVRVRSGAESKSEYVSETHVIGPKRVWLQIAITKPCDRRKMRFAPKALKMFEERDRPPREARKNFGF